MLSFLLYTGALYPQMKWSTGSSLGSPAGNTQLFTVKSRFSLCAVSLFLISTFVHLNNEKPLFRWLDIVTDLNTQNPDYLDIRHTERGIQRRKTKKVSSSHIRLLKYWCLKTQHSTKTLKTHPLGSQVGGNLHCIMAFQRVNWQKLGPWALNLENLRHDFHHSSAERAHGRVSEDGEERTSSKRLAHLGRSHSMGSQKDTSWKRLSNTTEYRQKSSPDSDLEEDITD